MRLMFNTANLLKNTNYADFYKTIADRYSSFCSGNNMVHDK